LELKSLINRSYNDQNRRFMDVFITEEGLKLLHAVRPGMKKQEIELSSKLTEEESEQLSTLLDKLRG
jgi:DNA-binding MarR family transcriptional regulator